MTEKKTVTGVLRSPDGEVVPGGAITFKLNVATTDTLTGHVVMPFPATAVADENGTFSIDLWPNDRGLSATYYTVSVAGDLNGSRIGFAFKEPVQVRQVDDGDFGKMVGRAVFVAKGLPEQLTETALEVAENKSLAAAYAAQIDPDGLEARFSQQVAVGVADVRGQFEASADDLGARAPLGANMLSDTRNWDSWCGGQKGVAVPLADAIGTNCAFRHEGNATTDGTVTVVRAGQFADFGIPVVGAIQPFVNATAYAGPLFSALIFDLDVQGGGVLRVSGLIGSPGYRFGEAIMSTSVLMCPLEGHGGVGPIEFGVNWVPVVLPGNAAAGWHMLRGYSAVGTSYNEISMRVPSGGRSRFALTLPYCRFGHHNNRDAWANEYATLNRAISV